MKNCCDLLKSICKLVVKVDGLKKFELSTGNLPQGGLPRNSMASITECCDMNIVLDWP